MKRSILTLIFTIGYILGCYAQNFVFKGKIINPIKRSVEISIISYGYEIDFKSIPLDTNNEFEYRTQLNDIAYLNFGHVDYTANNELCRMSFNIVEPNDEIKITFDAKNFWSSVKFEGKSAEKFNYYKEDYVEMSIKKNWEKQALIHEQKPIKEYFTYIDTVLKDKLNILVKFKEKVSTVFYKIQEADIKALVNQKRLSALYNQSTKEFVSIQALPYELQQTFFKDLPNQSDTTAKTQFYFQYLASLTYTYYSEFSQWSKSNIPRKEQSIIAQNQVFFHPSFAERMSGDIVIKSLEQHGINPDYQNKLADFARLYPNSSLLEKIQKIEETKQVFSVGKPAPSFNVLGLDGNELKLEDFKGKVIYLDFWASWCTPCIIDMKYANKVKEELKNEMDIVYIYISVDENEKAWKEAIKKYEINGLHGRASQDSQVHKDYAVSLLPSYFIIGKDGNFHTIQPIRPSINEGKSLINKLKEALTDNFTK